jgi:HlyD family secretion protein
LWIKLRVDQGRSEGLAQGLKAAIVLRSQPRHVLPGHVARVELVADVVTEERIAQIAFDAPPSGKGIGASVGELAEVTLKLPDTASTLVVPNASVQRQQGQAGVWLLDAGKPTFAPVRLGVSSLDGQVQVLEGLKSGDTIVVYSQKALSSGARVKIVDALVKASSQGGTP